MPKLLTFTEEHAPALAEVAAITGRQDVYCFTAAPGDGPDQYHFQSWVNQVPGVHDVVLGRGRAEANLRALLLWCRANPAAARAIAGGGA